MGNSLSIFIIAFEAILISVLVLLFLKYFRKLKKKVKKVSNQKKLSIQPSPKPLLLYVDNSNIFISAKHFAEKFKRENASTLRIHFPHFLYLVSKGTYDFDEVVWAGSDISSNEEMWGNLRDRGIEPVVIPRAESGENETVDFKLQLQMYRHVMNKYKGMAGTIALCSGDGKGFENEEGFVYDMKCFAEMGWKIEVYSWSFSCHNMLKDLAMEYGEFIQLDKHFNEITFQKNKRKPIKVRLIS